MNVFVKTMQVIVMAFIAVFVLASCGSDETKPDSPECAFPDKPNKVAPDWICDEPIDGVAVSAVGVAVKTAAGHSFTKNMATTDARVKLVQAMKKHVQKMIEQHAKSNGVSNRKIVKKVSTSVTSQINDETLTEVKTLKTYTSPDGKLYILLGVEHAATATVAVNALKISMDSDEAAWQQFRVHNGKDELAASIANIR